MEKEIWKNVTGYECLYQVSNLGRVKSLPRNGTIKKERILKTYFDKDNYEIVTLSKNNINKKRRVHRLVAEAFLPNPNNFPVINHKNHNPKDNNVNNLEWCTEEYNAKYSHKKRTVYQYSLNGELINIWESPIDAAKFLQLDNKIVSLACNGKIKTYKGYIWKYLNNWENPL